MGQVLRFPNRGVSSSRPRETPRWESERLLREQRIAQNQKRIEQLQIRELQMLNKRLVRAKKGLKARLYFVVFFILGYLLVKLV